MIDKKVGLMLYWCEGDKTKCGTWKVSVTTSDPKMLIYFIEWLIKFYKIPREKIVLRLHLWKNSDEEKAKKFWSKELKIKRFHKTWIKPIGKNQKFPNGVCRASVNGKELLNKILKDIERSF